MRLTDLRRELTDLSAEWKKQQESDIACKGEDLDALRAMPQEDLVRLAWRSLNAVAQVEEEYGHTISLIESHCEPSAASEGGWIVSQAGKDGGFNDLVKSLGHLGGYEIFQFWEDAKAFLEHTVADEERRVYFKIYPVTVTIGGEPRTTRPWRYSKQP